MARRIIPAAVITGILVMVAVLAFAPTIRKQRTTKEGFQMSGGSIAMLVVGLIVCAGLVFLVQSKTMGAQPLNNVQ